MWFLSLRPWLTVAVPTVQVQHTPVDPPDAAHASSLRSQFASLQLGGHNLPLSFQLSGQSLKL